MKIGYARVSTDDQNLDLQVDALRHAGCVHIFTDFGVSGQGFERAGLLEALSEIKAGGTLIVWRLDRLGRSLPKLIGLVDNLGRKGAHFRSLTENIDTTSSGGRLIFHIMGALAEFERSLISERTRAGMAAARARGQHLGRRPSLTSQDVDRARQALVAGENLVDLSVRLGVSHRTLRRYLNQTPAHE